MSNIVLSKKTQTLIENEMTQCIECNVCKSSCLMLEKYADTPKKMLSEEILPIVPFSCTLCDHCRQVCPKDINQSDIYLSLRRDYKTKLINTIKTTAVSQHQKNSFSKVFSTQVKQFNEKKRVFFPGCSLSSYSPDIVERIHHHINIDNDITIWLKCCGNPTHAIGDQNKFDNLYSTLNDSFESHGIEEVIVACQNCYQTISKNSPHLKVTSLYEVLDQGELPEVNHDALKSIALHDPCPTRHVAVIHDSVRNILSKMAINFEEFKLNKSMTQCCGSGGMIGVTNRDLSVKQMSHRASQTELDTIITYCEECVTSMQKGGKRSLHLLDLLFNESIKDDAYNQKKKSTLKMWQNRFVAKQRVDKIIQKMS